MTIDSHHHFWRYNPQEYGWISPEMAKLRRDFLPADLRAESSAAGVDGVISVQARQTEDETRALLDYAEDNSFIRGVVGWAPLVSPGVAETLEAFAARPKLRGVRHVLQDETDDRYMLCDDFNRGLAHLSRFNLRYDILIFERHLPQTIELVNRHPQQVFILDHLAKPKVKAAEIEPWARNIRELARRDHVYCKVSGLVTEADHARWTPEQLKPYLDTVLQAFSPKRLMFGSDWPVCLLAASYAQWYSLIRRWAAPLSAEEQNSLFGRTALKAYGLEAAMG